MAAINTALRHRTPDALPASALLLRFADSAKATAYFSGYQNRMKSCGTGGDLAVKQLWSDDSAATAIRTYAGAESYVDISVLQNTTVALLATTSTDPESQTPWSHTTAQTLQTTIDSP